MSIKVGVSASRRNDNIDGECSRPLNPDEVKIITFWHWMERAVYRKNLKRTERIEQMFDRHIRVPHFLPKSKEQLWIECAEQLTEACERVIDLATDLTFFRLYIADWNILYSKGIFGAIVIRMSRFINPSTNCLHFDKMILPERAFYTMYMEEINLISSIFNLAKDIANLKLTAAELDTYVAIVLHNDERPGLTMRFRNKIKRRKDFFLRALKAKFDHSGRQPLKNGVTVLDVLIAKIPELTTIGIMYANAVVKFEESHPHVCLPELHQKLFSRNVPQPKL